MEFNITNFSNSNSLVETLEEMAKEMGEKEFVIRKRREFCEFEKKMQRNVLYNKSKHGKDTTIHRKR